MEYTVPVDLTQYSTPKKAFISGRDQNHDTKKANVVYNFLAIWLFYFPKWAFLIGYYIAWQIDKLKITSPF